MPGDRSSSDDDEGSSRGARGAAAGELYRPPDEKSITQILTADQSDEALNRYKAQLLGAAPENVIVDAADPRRVIVHSITLLVDGRPEISMRLDEVSRPADISFSLAEGCFYRLRFAFYVQREIVTGLKYKHKISRHGITVDREEYMVGSYAPRPDLQTYTTPVEEAPSGMMHRGRYKIKSQFTDDDHNDWLSWGWTLDISKDWK